MTVFEAISAVTFVSGLSMMLLRIKALAVLNERGLLERLGNPRRLFFSDTLPIRLLSLRANEVGRPGRLLFLLYFCSWVSFLGGLIFVVVAIVVVPGAWFSRESGIQSFGG